MKKTKELISIILKKI